MMGVDKGSVEEKNVESESLEVDDSCNIKSQHLSSNRISSSSPSSSESEQKVVNEIDTEGDFVGLSVPLEVNNEMNDSLVKETEKNATYDREAILHQLVNSANSESERQILIDLIQFNSRSGKRETNTTINFSKIWENDEMTAEVREKTLVDGLRESLKLVPDSMMHLLTGWFHPGDCGRSLDRKPDWLDMDKLRRGQKFAQDHMFPIIYAEMIGLLALFSFEDGLKPLVVSGKSSTPYEAFKRYLSTAVRVRHWYTQDPWTKGTAAWKDISVVRSMHAAARQRLNASTNEEIDAAAIIPNAWCPAREILLKDFSETCEAPGIGQCPYLVGFNNPHRPKGINQVEMALTQWTTVGLITLFPKSAGVQNATDEDIEAFCHLWRSLGYQLGMEEEYNFCRGTLKEIRQRSQDFIDTWVKPNLRTITPEWEHMGRCLVTGVSPLIPFATFETTLLQLIEIIELKTPPRFYASLSYKDWIVYNFTRSLFRYGTKLPGVTSLLNTIFDVVLNKAEKFTPKQFEAVRIKLPNHTAGCGSTGSVFILIVILGSFLCLIHRLWLRVS